MDTRQVRTNDVIDEDGRLANRAALLTLLSLCCFLLALLAMPMTFQRTERLAPRVLATSPLVAGAASALVARAARARLRAHRSEAASVREDSPGGPASAPPHDRRG